MWGQGQGRVSWSSSYDLDAYHFLFLFLPSPVPTSVRLCTIASHAYHCYLLLTWTCMTHPMTHCTLLTHACLLTPFPDSFWYSWLICLGYIYSSSYPVVASACTSPITMRNHIASYSLSSLPSLVLRPLLINLEASSNTGISRTTLSSRRNLTQGAWARVLWHAIYFFFFSLFNSLYYYGSLTADNFTSYLFLFTYDSFWLSTNTPLWLSISTIVSWLTMTPLLYVDSGWVVYCTLTHNESFTYCLRLLLFTWLIVLNYYKYRRLWSLRPQTWLLVSYGTTANKPPSLFTSL